MNCYTDIPIHKKRTTRWMVSVVIYNFSGAHTTLNTNGTAYSVVNTISPLRI